MRDEPTFSSHHPSVWCWCGKFVSMLFSIHFTNNVGCVNEDDRELRVRNRTLIILNQNSLVGHNFAIECFNHRQFIANFASTSSCFLTPLLIAFDNIRKCPDLYFHFDFWRLRETLGAPSMFRTFHRSTDCLWLNVKFVKAKGSQMRNKILWHKCWHNYVYTDPFAFANFQALLFLPRWDAHTVLSFRRSKSSNKFSVLHILSRGKAAN